MPTKTLAGKTVEVDHEGYLVNHQEWNREMAPELAKEEGIEELTPAHWKVIDFIRADYEKKGQVPTIRRMKNEGGIPTGELYQLFPKGPAKKSAKIAGFGKPQGCV
ncbi:MAG: TusE/DsrC/DsvC family sulfur relay protein [Calditrichia bacterium]